MPRVRVLAVFLLLATLALVLSSCSSTGPTLSFSIDVPYGASAHATLQASDGHVLQTVSATASGSITFDNAPSDSLVTVSMQSQSGGAASTPTEEYTSLTVPSSLAANHDFYEITVPSSATVQVSGVCPSSATSIQVFVSGTGPSSVSCTGTPLTFTTTVGAGPQDVAVDGTISLALLAFNGTAPIATAGLLNQSFPNNAITVSGTDWTASVPASDSATLQFPALPANQSATGNFNVAALEQGVAVPVEATASASAAAGAASMSMSEPFVPLTASNYAVSESFGNTFNDGSLKWTSSSSRQHLVASLPVNETVDTQTDMWPLLQSFSWSSNGSDTVSYGANAGTKAATYRGALVGASDTTNHTAKVWEFLDAPAPSTAGTLDFPGLPASMSAYVPAPVATANGSNTAELVFTDAKVPSVGVALLGLLTPFAFLGSTPPTGNFHTLTATTNAPLNPTSVAAALRTPLIGLR